MKTEIKRSQKDIKRRGTKVKINALTANEEIEKSLLESINKYLYHFSDDDDEGDNIKLDIQTMSDGYPPFHQPIKASDDDVKFQIQTWRNANGHTRIHQSIKTNGATVDEFEIQTSRNDFGHSKAHHPIKARQAICQLDLPITSAQAQMGARCVTSSLLRAVSRGQLNKVKVLLGRGAKVNVRDDQGHTLLMLALRNHDDIERDELFTYLLEKGVSVDKIDKVTHRNVLCWASHLGHHKQVRQIIAVAGGELNLNHKDFRGRTALHLAALQGHVKIVRRLARTLQRYGLTLDEEDEEGMTPLLSAARMGHSDIFEVLGAAGASTTRCDSIKRLTALEWSVLGERERAEREKQRRHLVNITRKISGLLLPSVHSESPRARRTRRREVISSDLNNDDSKHQNDLSVENSRSSCSSFRREISPISERSIKANNGVRQDAQCTSCINSNSCDRPSRSSGKVDLSRSSSQPEMCNSCNLVDSNSRNSNKICNNCQIKNDKISFREIIPKANRKDTRAYRSNQLDDRGSLNGGDVRNRAGNYSIPGFGYRKFKLSRDDIISKASSYSSLGHNGSQLDGYREESNGNVKSDSSCSNDSGLRSSSSVLKLDSSERGKYRISNGIHDKINSNCTNTDNIKQSSLEHMKSTTNQLDQCKDLSISENMTAPSPAVFPKLSDKNSSVVSVGKKTHRSVKFVDKTVERMENIPTKALRNSKNSSDRVNSSSKKLQRKSNVGSTIDEDLCRGELKRIPVQNEKSESKEILSDKCGEECNSWCFITEHCPICSTKNLVEEGNGSKLSYNAQIQRDRAVESAEKTSTIISDGSEFHFYPIVEDSSYNAKLQERLDELGLVEFHNKLETNNCGEMHQKTRPELVKNNLHTASTNVNRRHLGGVFPTLSLFNKLEDEEEGSYVTKWDGSDIISDVSDMTNLLRIKSEQMTSSFLPPVSQRLMSARSCSTDVTLVDFDDEDDAGMIEGFGSAACMSPEVDIRR